MDHNAAVTHEIEIDALLRSLVADAAWRAGADRATLFLVDPSRGALVSRTASRLPESPAIRLRAGEGVAGAAAAKGRTIAVPDCAADPRFARRFDDATGYETRNLLACPVRDGTGRVVGVFELVNLDGDPSDPRRIAEAEEAAREAGAAIERSTVGLHLAAGRAPTFHFNRVVGECPAMLRVYDRVRRAAATEATVLVRGETGTGKEAIGRAIHVNSARSDGPIVKADCAALPATLVENELFGHERGAYTGADRQAEGLVRAAEHGTLFLDEVGDLPLEVQGKLLRLVADREYLRVGGSDVRRADVRFVCATHRDLAALVAAGRFRADLYFRLRVIEIALPPLRERGADDLELLAFHFLREACRRHGRSAARLSAAATTAILAYAWPGNVRELENAIESAVVLADACATEIGPDDLPPEVKGSGAVPAAARAVLPQAVMPLAEVEHVACEAAVVACGGNRSEAARLLRIGRNTLARKLRR